MGAIDSIPADAGVRPGAWSAAAPPASSPALDAEMSARQIGHLRHIENLARQPAGDWSHMGTKMHGQEDFGSYRFQLAFMAYALALAHMHRAPNAPGAFRDTFDRLIAKMLHPDVWMYWRNVSQGGHLLNAHLRPSMSEQWDPVVENNIMFSAYVQSMTLMYDVLFRDPKYAEPGAITFEHVSHFWGDGAKVFAYDQNSLNEHLYWKMVETGYLGIACEPNCVFQICNQPAILGFRMHDILTGGERASEVIEGFQRAWADFGHLGQNGHFNALVVEDSRMVLPNALPVAWIDGWTGALMNMWNRDFIRGNYRRQVADFLIPGEDGAISVKLSPPPNNGGRVLDYDAGDFGFVAIWASEMGDAETLEGLKLHADRHMAPTWSRGGLYYPRRDEPFDEAGNLVRVEPITGNALLAYAALNTPDGLWGLFNRPWGAAHFAEPLIMEVSETLDVSRAAYDSEKNSLLFTLAARADLAGPLRLLIDNVFDRGRGAWTLAFDGAVLARGGEAEVSEPGAAAARRIGAALELVLPAGGRFSLSWSAG